MKIQDIFKWASASFAVIPGLIIMATNLGTPPGISKYVYGGLIEATGAFSLLLLAINKKSITKLSHQKITKISISIFILFIISMLTYIFLFNNQIIYNDKYDTSLFFPFWYGDDLGYMIQKAGSKYNAISLYGPQAIIDGIYSSKNYLEFSRAIFTIVYIFTFEMLVIGFGLLGLRNVPEI